MGKHRSGAVAAQGRGKHRAPTTAGKGVARVAVAGAVLAAPVTMGAGVANAASGFDHDAIAACESGGNARAQNSSSSASGLYQFIDSTWKAYGGSTAHAKDASVSEQRRVAERAFAVEGYSPWNASRSCWSGKIGSGTKTVVTNAGESPSKQSTSKSKSSTSKQSTSKKKSATKKSATKKSATKSKSTVKSGGKYTVVSGDSLVKLATEFYGDKYKWRELWNENRDVVGANPHLIYPGQVLDK